MKRTQPGASAAAPTEAAEAAEAAGAAGRPAGPGEQEERADCVLCGEPTEYPASTRGVTLCPVCGWQEAQRTACSG